MLISACIDSRRTNAMVQEKTTVEALSMSNTQALEISGSTEIYGHLKTFFSPLQRLRQIHDTLRIGKHRIE